jgi:Ca2+-binding EF-hand superfamily protein
MADSMDAPPLLKETQSLLNGKDEFFDEDAINREYGSVPKSVSAVKGMGDGEQEMTPEEKAWSEKAKQIFTNYDKNKDGCISEDELTALFEALADNLTPGDVKRLFKEADKDGNGNISFSEFIDWLMRPTKQSLGKAVLQFSEAFKCLFDVYDPDGSGFIDKAEFEEIHVLLQGSIRMTKDNSDSCGRCADPLDLDKDHKEAFRLIDTEGTGRISFIAFVDWMKEHVPSHMNPQTLLEQNKSLAKALVDIKEHIEMAQEGYIKEEDGHILQRVVDTLAQSAQKLKEMMQEKKVNVKPQWTEPPTGLSVARLKSTHMEFFPLNLKRTKQVSFEVLCLPLPGDYEDTQSRVWLAEVVRKVVWKEKNKVTTEEPTYYSYDRKTFSWTPMTNKSDEIFKVSFDSISPGVGVFCLLKTTANFGVKIRWPEILSSLEGAVDMKIIDQQKADKFLNHMKKIAIGSLSNDGYFDEGDDADKKDRLANEWLYSTLIVKPREVMATLSDLGVVAVDPAWEDFSGVGDD